MDKELQITINHKDFMGKAITIVSLNGSLDAHTVTKVEEAMQHCIADNNVFLIFDLMQLNYVSSAGMGLMIALLDSVRDKGGDMIMASAKPNVQKVFQILGFDKIFRSTNDIDSATQVFSKERP